MQLCNLVCDLQIVSSEVYLSMWGTIDLCIYFINDHSLSLSARVPRPVPSDTGDPVVMEMRWPCLHGVHRWVGRDMIV